MAKAKNKKLEVEEKKPQSDYQEHMAEWESKAEKKVIPQNNDIEQHPKFAKFKKGSN